ncbi:hypothetical protein EVAR_100842_1 [Eumeta japonica]|uniref:MADF domain-containing protein n=1 Tax=Eumeta variegata TaxID=151549 RepID=A0A4C2A7M2_EUMVA|nr:hypothetical protein EVAR_100842_1 [Eumeta japonica]
MLEMPVGVPYLTSSSNCRSRARALRVGRKPDGARRRGHGAGAGGLACFSYVTDKLIRLGLLEELTGEFARVRRLSHTATRAGAPARAWSCSFSESAGSGEGLYIVCLFRASCCRPPRAPHAAPAPPNCDALPQSVIRRHEEHTRAFKMSEKVKPKVKEREFFSECIQLYRELPSLWNVKSKEYHDRNKKKFAYETLLSKYRDVFTGKRK